MNKEWFVFKGTHHLGPFSVEEIAQLYQKNEVNEQSLVWKEGAKDWTALSKTGAFSFLFKVKGPAVWSDNQLPPIPEAAQLPKALPKKSSSPPTSKRNGDEELPPPIPLDAILDIQSEQKAVAYGKKSKASKYILFAVGVVFVVVCAWFGMNERNAQVQLRIKGLMPVYLEKLEMMATRNSPRFEVALALSLDSKTIWASTNKEGEISAVIRLQSIPKRVLGSEEVALNLKGGFKNHIGKFEKMTLTKGSKFLPGEYNVHVEAKQTHFLNSQFKSLSAIDFFKSLNKKYTYETTALIYPGTPREFEKKLDEQKEHIEGEMLKPYQEKLERIQTFESLLNATSQNYLMELEKAKTGQAISSFEKKFMKEISPLLQSLVLKANELSSDPKTSEEAMPSAIAPYREQVLLGKQIGEMASDMITKTQSFKKLTPTDKSALKAQFEKRARVIKGQIDSSLKKLEEAILKISRP